MPAKNVIREKSFEFALTVVSVSKRLMQTREYVLSKQLMRCGTSIGANIREAEHAVSRPDFQNKLSIALKEANETDYWIDLLNQSSYLLENDFLLLKEKNTELLRLLISILNTLKKT